ncbi:MAG: protein-disulfide reductase DsbD family protein [Candidatus Obscuribacterales bacterium]
MRFLTAILMALVTLLPLAPTSLHAQSLPASQSPAQLELIADTTAIVPGQPFKLGVRFKLEPGWHIYYKNPGDTGYATEITPDLPAGFQIGETEWKQPQTFTDFGMKAYGYTDETILAVTVTAPADLKPGDSLTIKVDARWLACHENCIPGTETLTITLPVAETASPANPGAFAGLGYDGDPSVSTGPTPGGSVLDGDLKLASDKSGSTSLLKILLFAFIGGLILNVMPCVLPVVSLKILSFVEEAGQKRDKIFKLGLAYSAGTVATCSLLALVVIVCQLVGYSIGWGFQFQQPLFLLGMAALVTVMSLGLFGVFMVQVSSGKQLQDLSQKSGYGGAFFTGVVATVLSTPCTAPFLGTAIGFAFAQPWWSILLIFATIGLGLAAPYLVLSANPAWMKLLPRPGMWMEHFKQAMGFVLLGSAVWLLSVLGKQVGPEGLTGGISFILTLGFAAWLIGNFADFNATRKRKLVVWAIALAVSASSFAFFTWPSLVARPAATAGVTQTVDAIAWEKFSKEAVDQGLRDGKVVFIDFTAEWCQTCKFNEATVLNTDAVKAEFDKHGVLALKADWTLNDPEITALLRKFQRSGVPLYVVLSPHRPDQPIILPELITKQLVREALETASRP